MTKTQPTTRLRMNDDLHRLKDGKRVNVPSIVVLSNGYIAKLAGCAPRTVSKWCDGGKLPCYRLPGSLDRRVLVGDAIRFFREYGMAAAAQTLLNLVKPTVILVSCPAPLAVEVRAAALPFQACVHDHPDGPISAAVDIGSRPPVAVVAGAWVGESSLTGLAAAGRQSARLAGYTCLFGIVTNADTVISPETVAAIGEPTVWFYPGDTRQALDTLADYLPLRSEPAGVGE
jgi:hypothetical protein